MNKPKTYQKAEALAIWRSLQPVEKINMCEIAYKHEGTTIDEDGIRLCGSYEFITSVMSRLKDLLDYENPEQRIGIAWSEIVDKDTKCVIPGRFRCSIQVHERGREAKIMNHIVKSAAERIAQREGREVGVIAY